MRTRSLNPFASALVLLSAMALVVALLPGAAQAQASGVDVNILRAEYFTNYSGTFVNIEARADVDTPDEARALDVSASVNGTTYELSTFVDAGEYMYHRTSSPRPIDAVPAGQTVTVTVADGGSDSETITEWIPGDPQGEQDERGRPYQEGFYDEYLDAVEITARIEALAAEFPEIAEIVELPYQTNGYRRQAQAMIGTSNSNRFYATTHAWGHEGGNDWSIATVDPGGPNASLDVDVDGTAITVSLATDDEGALTSTAAEVVAALNAELGDVLEAHTYRGNDGGGVVPVDEQQFSDFLSAPPHVPREPFTVKMIRIGKHRDGSKVGVFAYAQEHAREFQTSLTALETAERLLRNYKTDPETRRLVDGLDLFIIPVVNPDGTNYAHYDYAAQRKNMTNHCGPEDADPNRRNSWGVDLNRNHSVGSASDGYSGASTTNCLSGTYAGPDEHSEPEARNLKWVAETFDNVKFSMNIHSHGGYFMWSPGAYISDGRIPLPRPTLGVENYFWEASERILGAIKDHRGTVIHPGRTGPIPDVLYSAGGNSADELYYNHDIIAWSFEVGAQIWSNGAWRTPPAVPGGASGFQPQFPEAKDQAMEFSNGLIEMAAVALDLSRDRVAPRSELVVTESGGGQVGFTFTTSEPATVYYTTDGTDPDYDSAVLEARETRDTETQTITVPVGTEVRWFSVDIVDNVERNYDPARGVRTYRSQRVRP